MRRLPAPPPPGLPVRCKPGRYETRGPAWRSSDGVCPCGSSTRPPGCFREKPRPPPEQDESIGSVRVETRRRKRSLKSGAPRDFFSVFHSTETILISYSSDRSFEGPGRQSYPGKKRATAENSGQKVNFRRAGPLPRKKLSPFVPRQWRRECNLFPPRCFSFRLTRVSRSCPSHGSRDSHSPVLGLTVPLKVVTRKRFAVLCVGFGMINGLVGVGKIRESSRTGRVVRCWTRPGFLGRAGGWGECEVNIKAGKIYVLSYREETKRVWRTHLTPVLDLYLSHRSLQCVNWGFYLTGSDRHWAPYGGPAGAFVYLVIKDFSRFIHHAAASPEIL